MTIEDPTEQDTDETNDDEIAQMDETNDDKPVQIDDENPTQTNETRRPQRSAGRPARYRD